MRILIYITGIISSVITAVLRNFCTFVLHGASLSLYCNSQNLGFGWFQYIFLIPCGRDLPNYISTRTFSIRFSYWLLLAALLYVSCFLGDLCPNPAWSRLLPVTSTTNLFGTKRRNLRFSVIEEEGRELSFLPAQGENIGVLECCQNKRCTMCLYVSKSKLARNSTTNKHFFTCLPDDKQYTCDTRSVIYLLLCEKCDMQYVGETTQKIKERFNQHRRKIIQKSQDTELYRHFCSENHTVADLKIMLLESISSKDKQVLQNKELKWIKVLNTGYPYGLNDKIKGFGCAIKRQKQDLTISTSLLTQRISGIHKNGKKKHRRNNKINYGFVNDFVTLINTVSKNKLNLLYQLYRAQNRSTLMYTKKILFASDYEDKIRLIYLGFLNETTCKRKLNQVPSKKKKYVTINYVNRFSETLNPAAIFNSKKVLACLSDVHSKYRFVITWKCSGPIRNMLCNYNRFLRGLTNDEIFKIVNSPCECSNSPFKYEPVGHIVTGDLDIVKDKRIRELFQKGAKYRALVDDSCHAAAAEISSAMTREIIDKCRLNRNQATRYTDAFNKILSARIINILNFDLYSNHENVHSTSTSNYSKKYLKQLQNRFIITPADKAANNYIFTCTKYYVLRFCQELGIRCSGQTLICSGNDTYQVTSETEASLIERHTADMRNFNLCIPSSEKAIPHIFGIPKLHKNPYGTRFISGAKKCTTRLAASKLLIILQFFQIHFQNYCLAIFKNSNKHCYWAINSSQDIVDAVRCNKTKFKTVATFDFSTLYTKLGLDVVQECLFQLLDLLFKNASANSIAVSMYKKSAMYIKNDVPKGYEIMHISEIKELIAYVVNETFVKFGDYVYKQAVGVPMGGNSSPQIASLTLSFMEYKFMQKINANYIGLFRYCYRYIDDVIVFNCPNFMEFAKEIYDSSLPLTATNFNSKVAQYLDCDINLDTSKIKVYDKTKDFNFSVVKYLFSDSNIPKHIAYAVTSGQIIRFSRICTDQVDFLRACRDLCLSLQSNGFQIDYITSLIVKLYCNNESRFYKFSIFTKTDLLKFVRNCFN